MVSICTALLAHVPWPQAPLRSWVLHHVVPTIVYATWRYHHLGMPLGQLVLRGCVAAGMSLGVTLALDYGARSHFAKQAEKQVKKKV